jgi:uncharacterized protein (UPF0332 family)
MKAETADYLAKARATLADAQQIAALPLPHIAAREAYLAVFHAAEAYIFEHTGKVAKTHRGVRSEFARLARAEPRIGRDLVTFLGTAYQFGRAPTTLLARPPRRSHPPKPLPPLPLRCALSTPSANCCHRVSHRRPGHAHSGRFRQCAYLTSFVAKLGRCKGALF